MARAWCKCDGCNRVLFQDTALWKGEKPFCEACAPKGAKRREAEAEPEPEPPVKVDEVFKDSLTGG